MLVRRYFNQQVKQKRFMRTLLKSAAALVMVAITLLLSSGDVLACASCGCTLSSDWENLQFSGATGLKMELRYDFLDQNQLRSGTKTISSAAASQITNDGDPQEVEKDTTNNYLTLGINYSFNHDWGVNVQVPYIDRKHSTLGTNSDGSSPADGAYDSHTKNMGDIKVVGRYQGFSTHGNFGVLYGVKLPTGSYTQTGTSTDPNNPGDSAAIDRGLQPGSGTTDVILGAYYADGLNQNWDYFTQAIYQKALNSRDDYKPGDGINLNIGLRYAGITGVAPQLQLNYRYVQHDVGANADQVSTGGTLLYISPGITVPISQQLSAYGFVQVPLYQDLNGVQLAPRYTASLGVRYSF
jgi:hypothetical protein